MRTRSVFLLLVSFFLSNALYSQTQFIANFHALEQDTTPPPAADPPGGNQKKERAKAPQWEACQMYENPGKNFDPRLLPPGLPPDWHDRQNGIRFAQEAIKSFRKKQKAPKVATHVIIDAKNAHNGNVTEVAKKYSVSAKVDAQDVESPKEFIQTLKNLAKTKPAVVTLSFEPLEYDKKIEDALKEVAKNTVIVVAAGNRFPHPMISNKYDFPHVMVGSASPFGDQSYFSQDGANKNGDSGVDIITGNDAYHFLKQKDGNFIKVSGTSYAAPQVGAVLSELSSILPGLDAASAKKLLKQSGNPLVAGPPDLFNAEALTEIALRLRKKGGVKNWSKHINDRDIYDFTGRAQKDLQQARALTILVFKNRKGLPPGTVKRGDCEKLREATALFESVFRFTSVNGSNDLLGDKKLKETTQVNNIAKSNLLFNYSDFGLPKMAQYYRNFDEEELAKNILSRIQDRNPKTNGFRMSSLRSAGFLPNAKFAKALSIIGLKSIHPGTQENAVYAGVAAHGEKSGPFLELALTKSGPYTPMAVGFMSAQLPEKTAMSVFKNTLGDPKGSLNSKVNAIQAAFVRSRRLNGKFNVADLGLSKRHQVFSYGPTFGPKVAHTFLPNKDDKQTVAFLKETLENPGKRSASTIRQAAALALGSLGYESGYKALMDFLPKAKAPNVRDAVARSLLFRKEANPKKAIDHALQVYQAAGKSKRMGGEVLQYILIKAENNPKNISPQARQFMRDMQGQYNSFALEIALPQLLPNPVFRKVWQDIQRRPFESAAARIAAINRLLGPPANQKK